jgi:ankyrin repeat protein
VNPARCDDSGLRERRTHKEVTLLVPAQQHESLADKYTKSEELTCAQEDLLEDEPEKLSPEQPSPQYQGDFPDESPSSLLLRAAALGDRDTVCTFLQNGADVRAQDAEGLGLLHLAVRGKAGMRLLEELVVADPGAVLRCDANGWLPLHWACQEGHIDAVRFLTGLPDAADREQRRCPCLQEHADKEEDADLMAMQCAGAIVAAWQGDVDFTTLFIDAVPLEDLQQCSATAMVYATEKRGSPVLEVLTARGADPHRSRFYVTAKPAMVL